MIFHGSNNQLLMEIKDKIRMERYGLQFIKVVLLLAVCLVVKEASVIEAEELSDSTRIMIEQEFPGAEIKEISEESVKGEVVKEIELITKDGTPYEVHVAENGQLLKARAQDDELPWIGGKLDIGMAVVGERDAYKGAGSELQPAPFFRYENGPLEIMTYEGLDLSLKVFGSGAYSIALKGSVLFEEGYDADDSDFLKGMDELGTLYNTGLEFEGQLGDLEVGLEVLQDVSGEHKGQEAEISLEYQWMLGGFEFRPGLSLTWLSSKTIDYFYGVSPGEANVTRSVYSPGSSYEIGAELMVQRPLFGNFTFVGIAGVSTFGNEIKDSPLVDESYEIEGVLGVMYTF